MKNFEKIKNYIKEKYNKNIHIIQFIFNIILIIALICSLIMTTNLYKRLNDVSKQVSSITNTMNSQQSDENDIDVSSEDEPVTDESDSSTVTSTESTSTESITSSAPVNPAPAPTVPSPAPPSSTASTSTESQPSNTTTSTSTATDLDLLACVIYQEAGGNGSCDNCRRRVADVVLNRKADPRFPNTIKDVLTARNQYGRFYYTGVVWPSRSKNANEQAAVARAYRIAGEVLNGQHSELYGNGYVWQAGFKQGTNHIYCCGTYFGK